VKEMGLRLVFFVSRASFQLLIGRSASINLIKTQHILAALHRYTRATTEAFSSQPSLLRLKGSLANNDNDIDLPRFPKVTSFSYLLLSRSHVQISQRDTSFTLSQLRLEQSASPGSSDYQDQRAL
jgi:hypothetical protein